MKNTAFIFDRFSALCNQHDALIEKGIYPPRQLIQNLLTVTRMIARCATERHNAVWLEYRRLKHQYEVAKRNGITFLPAKMHLQGLEQQSKDAQSCMAQTGEILMIFLDKWQEAGATYNDLLRLCNADYPGMRKLLREFYDKHADREETFSGLVFIHNLDYKNPRDTGWLEDTVDAPMTHCIKAWEMDKLLNDPAGRAAAHEALEQCFPDLMENALTMRVDEDGRRCLYNTAGECVGSLDNEEV